MKANQINIFIHNNSKEIGLLYYKHRDAFINFGKKYGLDYDDLTDIYQEAFIALRNKALSGKLEDVKSSLKTYLFGIGKYMIFDRLKEKRKTTNLDNTLYKVSDEEIVVVEIQKPQELTLEQRLLKQFFKKLGKKCQELLTMFYSRGLSIDDIIELSDYSSSSVVRSQKSRCIKTLRELIKQSNNYGQ